MYVYTFLLKKISSRALLITLNKAPIVKRFTKQACRENVVASFFPLEYLNIYIYIYIHTHKFMTNQIYLLARN